MAERPVAGFPVGDPVLIRGARLVDPEAGLDRVADLRLAEGRIAAVGADLREPGDAVVEADGLVAAPGFCDMHVHFREPGLEYKETVASGAAAAVAGGVHRGGVHGEHRPGERQPPRITAHIREARQGRRAGARPIRSPHHPGDAGERISEFGALRRAGARWRSPTTASRCATRRSCGGPSNTPGSSICR